MNSLAVALGALIILFLAYKFYAKKLESLWQIDPKRSTPAFSKYDSIDYIPAFFMLITTLTALLFQMNRYFKQKEPILFIVSFLLIMLAGFMVYEVAKVMIYGGRKKYA